MQKVNAYKLPASGEAREHLREKGQFWTPDWVAEAMVDYVLADKDNALFDPAVGAGAFFRAAKRIAGEKGIYVSLSGMDVDPTALEQAIQYGLKKDDLSGVKIGDFVFQPPPTKLPAIVANPPYIRHHRISATIKEQLKHLSLQTIGKILDGRAGLHVYFLIRALTLLSENGRLAFIMPADTCEGKFANDLWFWIAANFTLDVVITFTSEASPFPNVDTNPLIFFIRKAKPKEKFLWVKCDEAQTEMLKMWVRSGFEIIPENGLTVIQRELTEGLNTGLSRPPVIEKPSKYVLGDFAQIVRGVATGANEFFFMTYEQVKQLGIPDSYFVRAIGRTRDVPSEEITQETLDSLQAKGRPTFLLALNGETFENYPEKLKKYLKDGETLGLPQRPLISQRKPWYKTETRTAPPFLFSYLGRRNSRFIRNTARIIPLTSFLCVYPKSNDKEYIGRLWKILNHPATIANLVMIGKSYGDGAVKVEPRSLEKLPIPENVIEQFGMPTQMRLFEDEEIYKIDSVIKRRKT
ncbi:MAG: SAM-dependent methyltransferase [Dehalococcoidia bacterium]|nr:MAG: SAM-dependent methyltransferase [Dehalococcoidia bacterium]